MKSLPLITAMLVATLARAGSTQPADPPEIHVTGEAVRSVSPDRAEIDLAVVTQSQTAETAADVNATKLDAVLRAVREAAGADASIQTVRYALTPNYRYDRAGGEPTITGYTASNVVRVQKLAIDVPGRVMDAAIAAGANQVERLAFLVSDAETEKLLALADAAREARRKAGALAEALGLEITGVLSVSEGFFSAPPAYAQAAAVRQLEAAVDTPIEPGEVEVRARITLRVRVSPR